MKCKFLGTELCKGNYNHSICMKNRAVDYYGEGGDAGCYRKAERLIIELEEENKRLVEMEKFQVL